ncbi:MAG: hypothetical protein ACW976_06925 [Candidatus Ranarchaeia archaeon]
MIAVPILIFFISFLLVRFPRKIQKAIQTIAQVGGFLSVSKHLVMNFKLFIFQGDSTSWDHRWRSNGWGSGQSYGYTNPFEHYFYYSYGFLEHPNEPDSGIGWWSRCCFALYAEEYQ